MVSEQNTQLTDQQIAKLAYDAGFRGSQIGVMTAIVLAESGGQTHPVDNKNVDSHGNVTSIDRGLVQINSTHTEFTGNPYDPAQAERTGDGAGRQRHDRRRPRIGGRRRGRKHP